MKLFEIARDVDLPCVSDREILGTGVIYMYKEREKFAKLFEKKEIRMP